MKLPLTGGCQCGQLRYEVRAEPLSVYVCHCTTCQRIAGSAFGMSMMVPRAAFVITQGTPTRRGHAGDSGRIIDGDFCNACGARVAHYPRANEKITIVKPGTLDDTSWLVPVGHIWTKSAQPWVPIPKDTVNHEAHPADLSGLLEAWKRHRETMEGG